eukprot:2526033-Prymnesium_polylepis.1
MAPDATVLVALRRPSSFLHWSFDGGGLLAGCTDAADSDTSAALPDHGGVVSESDRVSGLKLRKCINAVKVLSKSGA